jgi:hypothetical protein
MALRASVLGVFFVQLDFSSKNQDPSRAGVGAVEHWCPVVAGRWDRERCRGEPGGVNSVGHCVLRAGPCSQWVKRESCAPRLQLTLSFSPPPPPSFLLFL